jgi:glutamate N-acetyltransferase/amino-acid N-acetyltransferase
MEQVKGGVTAPAGFHASGVACGIKKRGKDLALILSEKPAAVAGTLTTNAVKASSVLWAQTVLKKGTARAIVANSGNANCCTGARGTRDNQRMVRSAASALKLKTSEVLVASTGVIGYPLPMERVKAGIAQAADELGPTGSLSAAEAIMTTDTRPKEIAVRFRHGGKKVTVGGIAKGSGMIAPNMATMLAFLTTDASAPAPVLREILRAEVDDSFNTITVDGEMSTNDMVLLLANGASKTPAIRKGTAGYASFREAVRTVCRFLAYEIVRDGEGVTRLMTVEVTGAATKGAALKAARQVANSLLVKTMVAGRDPNWGRVASAVGASGALTDPKKLTIRLGKTTVFRKGEPARLTREAILREIDLPEVKIGVNLGSGPGSATLLSGDLTEGYVQINAKYTS